MRCTRLLVLEWKRFPNTTMRTHREKAAKKNQSAGRRNAMPQFRSIILRIAKEYGATNVRVFGSFARGEQRRTSDLDLLVDLPEGMSLLDHAGLKVDLEDALGMKVDVVPSDSIKPLLRERILSEAHPL